MANPRGHMSLDVSQRQVLIDFFGDEGGMFWNDRLLLIKGDTMGEWIGATPTMSLQMIDLQGHRVVPLDRNVDIGVEFRRHVFLFDPLSAAELQDLVRRAQGLALAFGITFTKEDADGVWVV